MAARYLKKRGAEPRNIPFAKVLEAKLNALSGVKHLPWQLVSEPEGAGRAGAGGRRRRRERRARLSWPRSCPSTHSVHILCRFPNKVIADMERRCTG